MIFDIIPITSPKPTDCGATCLKMLLAFYGQDIDLDQLIKDCKTSITGSNAKLVIEAGKKYGLDMQAWQTSAEDLYTVDRPMIVWWMYNHFCVYCGMDEDGKVVICNPDRGRYRVSKGVFKSFYTGVCLSNGTPEDLPA